PDARTVEYGIIIFPSQTGKGYAQEMTRWTLEWAFIVGCKRKVILETAGWNDAAIHIYKKCGFVEEGRRREAVWSEGKWWDNVYMGILDREW
ncbi:acyl-CoA N-acyltransferase, partial [Atractiella rhizophila]